MERTLVADAANPMDELPPGASHFAEPRLNPPAVLARLMAKAQAYHEHTRYDPVHPGEARARRLR